MIFSILTHSVHLLIADMPSFTAFTFVHVPNLVQIGDAADRTLSVEGRRHLLRFIEYSTLTHHISRCQFPICQVAICDFSHVPFRYPLSTYLPSANLPFAI